jgi:hypothetical protein
MTADKMIRMGARHETKTGCDADGAAGFCSFAGARGGVVGEMTDEATKPPPEAPALPEWTAGLAYILPLSFQSGRHWDGTPGKPVSEMNQQEKVEMYLRSIGRTPTPRVWP